MSRVLGIDFGESRVGLAISDPGGRFALPHDTLRRTSDSQVITEIAELMEREGIARVVLGEPLNVDGSAGAAASRVRSFGRKLSQATGVEVVMVPETLTSVEAERRLRQAGTDPRRSRASVDAVAAQIILQEELASHRAPRSEGPDNDPVGTP